MTFPWNEQNLIAAKNHYILWPHTTALLYFAHAITSAQLIFVKVTAIWEFYKDSNTPTNRPTHEEAICTVFKVTKNNYSI
jgi:hypothetical protein